MLSCHMTYSHLPKGSQYAAQVKEDQPGGEKGG